MLIKKAIQQTNFTENRELDGNAAMIFITEEVEETILYFS